MRDRLRGAGTAYTDKDTDALLASSGTGHGFLIGEMPSGVFSVYKTTPVTDKQNAAATKIDSGDFTGGLLVKSGFFVLAWLKVRTASDSLATPVELSQITLLTGLFSRRPDAPPSCNAGPNRRTRRWTVQVRGSTDMSAQDKIVVITGASAGIGFATAIGLARHGATIAIICRNTERGSAALKAISEVAAASPRLFIADLSSQASIRELAASLHEQLPRIDVLVNNVGAAFAKREYTVDGIERTLAINHLAPFLLTNLILDLIPQASGGRIVNLTAGIPGILLSPDFMENLQGERTYSQFSAYRMSKVGNMLFTYELARRLHGTGITVNCVHPGPVATQFTQKAGGTLSVMSRILRPIMKSPEVGARTPIYLAMAPEVAGITGGYFVNCKQKRTAGFTYDRAIAGKHWEISERLTSLNSATTAKAR